MEDLKDGGSEQFMEGCHFVMIDSQGGVLDLEGFEIAPGIPTPTLAEVRALPPITEFQEASIEALAIFHAAFWGREDRQIETVWYGL